MPIPSRGGISWLRCSIYTLIETPIPITVPSTALHRMRESAWAVDVGNGCGNGPASRDFMARAKRSMRKSRPLERQGVSPGRRRDHDPRRLWRQCYRPSPASIHRADCLPRCFEGSIQLCVSASVYAESEDCVEMSQARERSRDHSRHASTIRPMGFWVRPLEQVRIYADPDDDIFLECAQAAQAAYLVTGNINHFPASLGECRVVRPKVASWDGRSG
jgi:hypothetical protein